VAGRLPGAAGVGLLDAARTAFTHGLDHAAAGAAITVILAAAVSAAFFRGVQAGSPATAAGEPQAEDRSELAA
jgi:DHA2 family multidrug resistance protein-like MFS transporter